MVSEWTLEANILFKTFKYRIAVRSTLIRRSQKELRKGWVNRCRPFRLELIIHSCAGATKGTARSTP